MDKTFSKLDYAKIEQYAARLLSDGKAMEENLQAIKNQFDRIGTDNVWSGTAAAETRAQFDQLSGKFVEFHSAVKRCSEYLNGVVANYRAVDNTILGK